MKRYLIPQMLHEWRSNIWLIIELMMVSGVVCYLSLSLYNLLYSVFEPRGFEYDDVYTVTLRVINPESPEFSPGKDTTATIFHDYQNMIARLRTNPHVEAVAISENATPFTLNYMGTAMTIEGQPDSIQYGGNMRSASPDIVRVLKLQPTSGITPEEMERRMGNGEIIISQTYVGPERPIKSVSDIIGRKMRVAYDSTTVYKVGAVIPTIARTTYESRAQGMFLTPIDESIPPYKIDGTEIIMRLRTGHAKQFEEEFKTDPSIRRYNNVVLNDLTSLAQRKESIERSKDIEVRMTIAMITFFLIIVFLGLLGSFWYRVQQRTSEIALRKVTGATNGDIFRRLMSESTILLLLGFIIGAGLFLIYLHYHLQSYEDETEVMKMALAAIGGAYVIMQLIVLLSVWIPGRRAMSVEPAIALKDE